MGRRLRRRRKASDGRESKLQSPGVGLDPITSCLITSSPVTSSMEETSSSHHSLSDNSVSLEVENFLSNSTAGCIQQCDRLPHLQPITSFSSISSLGNVILPSGLSAGTNRGNIISNSTVIEILVHLLCREREEDHAKRELLFKALCKVIKQWNNSLYLPLHALPDLQEYRSGLLRKFEFLFEEVQSKIAARPTQLVLQSFQLPPTGSPLTQLALTDTYQYQFLDDRYSREFVEIKVLGRGGFGVVVKARNKLDQRDYAVKIIIMDKQDSETNRKLLREVQALAQLDHPGIVRYHSTWLQLFAIPPHLWPQYHSSRKLKRHHAHPHHPEKVEMKNHFFPTSQVRIQELSSSAEPEDFEESSGGIVFADSPKKSNLISLKASKYDTILETDESNYNSRAECSLTDKIENCFNKKSTIYRNTKKLEINSVYTNKESALSHIFNTEKSSTTDSSFSKLEFETSSVSHDALISYDDVDELENDSVCKEKPLCTSTSEEYSNHCKNSLMLYQKHPKDTHMTLFIQMGLCGNTLADWISKRNALPVVQGKGSHHVDRKMCLDLFRQILLAVEYIHSKKIIHRDLKPPNIFFTEDGKHVQLGDFGLARSLPDAAPTQNGDETDAASKSVCLTPIINHSPNTGGVGTPIYAAPELRLGGFYGSESDMHNMGIILLELFHPFQTGSERVHVIDNLKIKRYLEPEFVFQWPDIAPWILKLTDGDPNKRPTVTDLLNSKLFSNESQTFHGSENVEMTASGISVTDYYSPSKELRNTFDNLRIGDFNHFHDDNHFTPQQIKITNSQMMSLVREKDEEIENLKKENRKLQEMVAQLQEQFAAVERHQQHQGTSGHS